RLSIPPAGHRFRGEGAGQAGRPAGQGQGPGADGGPLQESSPTDPLLAMIVHGLCLLGGPAPPGRDSAASSVFHGWSEYEIVITRTKSAKEKGTHPSLWLSYTKLCHRSEERRVGKEGRCQRRSEHKEER